MEWQILLRLSAGGSTQHASNSAPTKSWLDPLFSGRRVSGVDRRLLCLFLLSIGEGLRRELEQLFTSSLCSPLAVSSSSSSFVFDFWNMDMVQPRIRRRLADRSRSGFAGTGCGALFHAGQALPVCCGNVLCPGVWKSHGAPYNTTSVPLFVLAATKWKAPRSGGLPWGVRSFERRRQSATSSEYGWKTHVKISSRGEDAYAHPFRKPACAARARNRCL